MKIKSLATITLLSLAAIAARAADDGDILEFRPITDTVSADSPFDASREIRFTMRILPDNYTGDGLAFCTNNWELFHVGIGSEIVDDLVFPLQLGVVVSGQTRAADLIEIKKCEKNTKYTDITWSYTTKFGDYAMPLKIAGDGDGNAAGDGLSSGFDPSVSGVYFFYNTGKWRIRDAVTGRALNPYRRSSVATLDVPEQPRNGSFDMGENFGGPGLAYYIKTVDFDGVTYDGKNPYDGADSTVYWRVVNENATSCKPGDPIIAVTGLPSDTKDLFMYVWSENPDAVILPNGEKHTFKGQDGVSREYLVEKIQIVENRSEYNFRMRGVHRNSAAKIIMAPQIGYRFNGAGTLVEDFSSVNVLCIDPPEPTISAVLSASGRSESSYICSTNYATYVDTIRVTLTQPTNAEMRVKLGFKWGSNEYFPTNLIAVSAKDSGGYLEDNLLDGMEVVIPPNELSSADYYIYALGATKETATPPGITVTPLADAEFAPFLQATNSCYITVKGMSPVIVNPLGTAEAPAAKVTVRGNSPREFTVEILDSYRNLYALDGSNGHYTVTWDRGVGSVLSITNDINGDPLIPDEYGRLRFNVTYPATTNTYVSSFSVRNPEGLASAQSYITVETLQPATVTAEIAGGEVELVENDKTTYNVRFKLSDINDAMDAGKLYAFLEPANEAASNRTDAAFFTRRADGTPGKGVPFDMVNGVAFTGLGEGEAYAEGGLKILDGDNVSQPKYNVVLCTEEIFDAKKIFSAYASMPLSVGLLNATPAVTRMRLQGSSSYVRYSGATSSVVRLNDPRNLNLSIIAWNGETEVGRDIFAEDAEQVVLRWRIYEIPEDGDENVEPYDVSYTVGTNSVYELPGFDIEGIKKVVVQVQDKDMRNAACVQPDGQGGWKYVMDPADPDHDWWEDDDNAWGEEFVVYVPVNDKPVVNVTAVGGVQSFGGSDNNVYSEMQLPPRSIVADPAMGLLVTLSEKFDEGKVNVILTVKGEDVDGGFLTLGTTNLVFQKNAVTSGSKTMNVPIVDFDGTWKGGSSNKGYAHYQIEAKVVDSGAADTLYNPGVCDVYVLNVEPEIFVESKFADCIDASNAWEIAKNERVKINWTVSDIEPDMTNAMTVTCTVKGGQVSGESSFTSSNEVSVANGTFEVYFSESGYNYVILKATDKDGGSSEARVYFHIESSKNLFLYPSKPSSSALDSTEISDYLQASGIGFGRVWADGALAGIEYFMHTWTYGPGATTAFAFADGYTAGETDNSTAFVTSSGDHAETGTKYTSPLTNLDSFFYRWFARVAGESGGDSDKGSWTAYTPNPQVSKEDTLAGAATRLQLSLPAESKELVYADTSAMAIFAREYIPSDNLGDINRDGIPDVYVIKYKLSAGTYDAGADLVDFANFDEGSAATEGEGAQLEVSGGVDLLPSIVPSAYSSLIPGVIGGEFTAKLEIRGFDDNLNDATATQFPDGTFNNATIDGAKPEQKYTDPRTDPDSTLSLVEYLAWSEFLAENPDATEKSWSPERPTDPTKLDTDGDGFADGFEYSFWYMAHVGYIDANGNHRRITGRVFDPRNPGHGRRISSAEVARMMDPLTPFGSAAQANTRDTDNDGLPDVLEALIGTNPIDFDSDGDGLPDGWELMMAGTDPLLTHSALDAKLDTERNYDGDAMAYTTPKLEEAMMPTPNFIQKLVSFAAIDPSGDSDGVQWYVVKEGDEGAITYTLDETGKGTLLTVGDEKYIVEGEVVVTPENRVASDLEGKVFKAVAAADAAAVPGITAAYLRLAPAVIERGTLLSAALEKDVGYAVAKFATVPEKDCNAAWIYGNANLTGYGALAVARYQSPQVDQVLCELPDTERDVAYIHSLVYQEFGFDPRTAWSPNSPLTSRWGATSSDGAAVEGVYKATQGGYASHPARTRAYAAYDEFLVHSFFLNNGVDMAGVTYITDDTAPRWAITWSCFTTNPQGPNEPGLVNAENYFGRNSVNGADTDQDGVPDGWELYVMAGPKLEGAFVFAPPYSGFYPAPSKGMVFAKESYWSPFIDAAYRNDTDNQIYLGGQVNSDGLNQRREFAGTDSCGYYSKPAEGNEEPFSTTIVRPEEDAKWLNKFFPTDPWAADTDMDGVKDGEEASNFVYGSPVDNGKLWSIPGGGLNPCTVDTDIDGLPDGWEKQYAGKTVYEGEDADYAKETEGDAKGNPLQGLVDGMDGTVMDAFSKPHNWTRVESDGRIQSGKVNRDYDRDGLENWQEYMTGTMRCWRYDDPLSPWFAIPSSAYFAWSEELETYIFDIEAAKKATGTTTDDEFWYKTLVDKASGIYNPYFIGDMSGGWQYFSRVDNGWDLAFCDAGLNKNRSGGAYYFFYNRIGKELLKELWKAPLGTDGSKEPKKYMGTSPIMADSDQDGLDDYYELFHGMNPLLGESGVAANGDTPCDLVYDAWYSATEGSPVEALVNAWTRKVAGGDYYRTGKKPRGNGFDFEYYPWLNGLATADPDGDDVRNQVEGILPKVSLASNHSDPTPLWMTDSSYSNSLVRMFFRMPARFYPIALTADGFANPEDPEETFFFRDFAGYQPPAGLDPAYFGVVTPDAWQLAAADTPNWMFSFEENEGYDTDHDGVSDSTEKNGQFRSASDPIDADSPRRRQAMYFGGKAKPSVLQTVPEEREHHPLFAVSYPQTIEFNHYTVECWAKPETLDNATIVERAVRSMVSNPGDQRFVRVNFRLAVKDGKWYTKYDTDGTVDSNYVEVIGPAAKTEWTHLAATYDGKALKFYVNGTFVGETASSSNPEHGESAYFFENVSRFWGARRYPLIATIVGASVKSAPGDSGKYGEALAVTSDAALEMKNLEAYENFFQGFVDEIRIWDGARTNDEIADEFRVRYTSQLAADNREAVFGEWKEGNRQYVKGNTARAELRAHYAFDSVFGAMESDANSLRSTPEGFNDNAASKPALSRPADWSLTWLKNVYAAHGSAYQSDIWATWVPNTLAHLPRFDGTTIDSFYWSKDFEGDKLGKYDFPMTAEPVSKWTQMFYNSVEGTEAGSSYQAPGARLSMLNLNPDAQEFATSSNETYAVDYLTRFEFTARNLRQQGDDMIILGGAFAKYSADMWDNQGASEPWEYTGKDANMDGIPDWWSNWMLDLADGLGAAGDPEYEFNGDSHNLKWNSIVKRNGLEMTLREAYLRDLAAGTMRDSADADQVAVNGDFAQDADVNGDGLADWWEDLHALDNVAIADDTDNDGLNDFAEYLISETFAFAELDPRSPRTDGTRLDYFRKLGSVYFGEVLSDHDMMEDWWESLYPIRYISSGIYDAHVDSDGDGWSNFAECRFGSSPARISYLGVDSTTMNDFPTPIIKLNCTYNGAQNAAIYPVVVKAYSKKNNDSMPDAVWTIASSGNTDDVATDAESNAAAKKSKHIGMNPGSKVVYNLGPGSIVFGTLSLEMKDLTWESGLYSLNDDGSKNVFSYIVNTADTAAWVVTAVDQVRVGDDARGDIVERTSRAVIGEVNYQTGEVTIDLSKMQSKLYYYTYQHTDADGNPINRYSFDMIDESKSFVRIQYISEQTTTGYPKTFYLSDPDLNTLEKPSFGHLYEGENWFEAFVDMDGDGHYSAGEPYGFTRGVNVGWSGTEIDIALTDTSAVIARYRFDGDSCSCDRAVLYGSDAAVEVNSNVTSFASGGEIERVRIVRIKANGSEMPNGEKAVVGDFVAKMAVRPYITEADILKSGVNDIDGIGLADKYDGVTLSTLTYALVFGDGSLDQGINKHRQAPYYSIRRFDSEYEKAEIAASGKQTVFYGSSPVFTWNMNGKGTYSAFRVQVRDTAGSVVYDSGRRLAPAANLEGNYSWMPDDLHVDDMCRTDKGVAIFANAHQYTWRVQMYNVKYAEHNAVWSADSPQFRMNANVASEVNDSGYSSVKVALKYFGAPEVLNKALDAADAAGKIRVEAFTSPDFTGAPAASGFYSAGTLDSLTGDSAEPVVTLKGLASGSYYLRAYIDTDGDFTKDVWESWGYLNRRDVTSSKNIFTPVPVTVGPDVAKAPEAVIYIEDADTDGDWLPDAWEWVTASGSLTAKGPGDFYDGNVFSIKDDLQKKFTRMSASGSKVSANLRALTSTSILSPEMMVLLGGIDTTGFATSTSAIESSIAPELVEGGVTIESLELVDGKVKIKVSGKTVSGAPDASALYQYEAVSTMPVICNVYGKTSLAEEKWTLLVSRGIVVGGDAVELDVGVEGATSMFYRVELVK